MKQEEKKLLLTDLLPRIQHGVKATTKSTAWNDTYVIKGYKDNRFYLDCPVYGEGDDEWMIESIIPFLRPMSSMNDQEKKFIVDLELKYKGSNQCEHYLEFFYFCNEHHFDYRGLIPMGLALEATEDMYTTD